MLLDYIKQHFDFCHIINKGPFFGDILEFGTGSGTSTVNISKFNKKAQRIKTFDCFKGLPKSNKPVPEGWEEGEFIFDEDRTRKRLGHHNNIDVYTTMFCDLKEPSEYGISKIAGVNIDVDLYEGTIEALLFADKCEWENLLVRFDDWGASKGHGEEIKEIVKQHEEAAFYDFIKLTQYEYEFCYKYSSKNWNVKLVHLRR